MEPKFENLKFELILSKIRKIIELSERMAELKGENFNIFSILSMESAENKTHSEFLSELLNPQGTHGMGDSFLQAFLSVLQTKDPHPKQLKDFICKDAVVKREFHTGTVDTETTTGGRIDIYIKDSNDLSIAIENKIFAEDQSQQIERYCNFNPENNSVLYLTLNGTEPSKSSKGKLVAGQDFYLISYKEDIIDWLTECQRISTDKPILRETIKQYVVLLKKLTNQLTIDAMKEDISKIILEKLKEAKCISDNYQSTVNDVKEAFRKEVIERINQKLKSKSAVKGNKITNKNANIFIDTGIDDIKILVESFSGEGHWFKGLCVMYLVHFNAVSDEKHSNIKKVFEEEMGLKNENWGFGRTKLKVKEIEGLLDLSDLNVISKLADKKSMEGIAEQVAQQVVDFKNKHAENLNKNLKPILVSLEGSE